METELILPLALTGLIALAMAWDVVTFRIPNAVNGLLLALYPLAWAVHPGAMVWYEGLMAFALLFALGFALFVTGVAGGGDIKLLSVLGLWVGWDAALLSFVLYMALLGGALSLALIVLRFALQSLMLMLGRTRFPVPRVLIQGEPLPYGLAIGASFLWLLWQGEMPLTRS